MSKAAIKQAWKCRVCKCTDDDCRQCIERTGEPCHWVEPDLCSACVDRPKGAKPCPFCGSEHLRLMLMNPKTRLFRVACMSCEVLGPPCANYGHKGADQDPAQISVAVRRWNRRGGKKLG